MKKFIFSAISLGVLSLSNAQEEIITMGQGYANHIWYSFKDGVANSSAKDNWELAFEMKSFGVGVHANRAVEMQVWKYPENDVEIDTQIDTTGVIETWPLVFNSDESWSLGAFNQLPSGNFNYGWGDYNIVNHSVQGTSLYFIKLPNGDFKKFFIESKIMGTYTFKLCNLDNSGLITRTLSNTEGIADQALFGYYSITNDEFLNREPIQSDWDMVFTQYNAVVFGNAANQRVVGALLNENTQAIKISLNNPTDSYSYSEEDFSELINTIGYDWKELNYQNFQWFIHDTLIYVVKTQHGDYFELAFTSFSGQGTGNIGIRKQLLTSASISSNESTFFRAYPNPSEGLIHLAHDFNGEITLNLLDLSGRTVWTQTINGQSNLGAETLDLRPLNLRGTYFLMIRDAQGKASTLKLVFK